MTTRYTILGAGLAGISASYHIGHDKCIVYEQNNYIGGHIHSEQINGFTWDEGPHVSFTKSEYVKKLFSDGVDNDFLEYPVNTANYYKGNWIPHPAQSNLYAIPQPLRDACLKDFLKVAQNIAFKEHPNNYEEWLIESLGKSFYEAFPKLYTEKYWTLNPSLLTTDWVGERIFRPNTEDIKKCYLQPLDKTTHYISHVRYPAKSGFFAFMNKIKLGINVSLGKEINYISFKDKTIYFKDESNISYEKLISTIPLPELIKKSDAPLNVEKAADELSCTSVLLINVTAKHTTKLNYNWMYVYDESMYSTRINCTEKLSPANSPIGTTGIQVEVYFSRYKPLDESISKIAKQVCDELVEMGLIESKHDIIDYHTKWVQWANVIFDHNRQYNLNIILNWLSKYGLERCEQDLHPMTDWTKITRKDNASLQLAGRFAEWKYYWTDDCVLRGLSFKL